MGGGVTEHRDIETLAGCQDISVIEIGAWTSN